MVDFGERGWGGKMVGGIFAYYAGTATKMWFGFSERHGAVQVSSSTARGWK